MWAWSRSTPIDAAHQHAMGCVSLRLVAMETQLRRDFKSATRLFSGLKERGHYTIGLECVYILSVQRMPGTWTDSWVEMKGFLRYGKTPCKKWSPSSQKWSPSSTSVRPLKWWVHNSTEESHFWFIARVLPTWTQFLPPSLPTYSNYNCIYFYLPVMIDCKISLDLQVKVDSINTIVLQ